MLFRSLTSTAALLAAIPRWEWKRTENSTPAMDVVLRSGSVTPSVAFRMSSNRPRPSTMWWALVAAALVLVVVGGGVVFAVRDRTPGDAVALGDPVADATGRTWLFSQTACSGSMSEQGDGTYRLTLEQVDDHVTAFTDRPDRDTAVIPASALYDSWSDLFADSPPNAVMIEHDPIGGSDSWVVELIDPVLEGSTVTFTAIVLGEEDHSPSARRHVQELYASPPATFGDVSLFIDDVDDGSAANKPPFHPVLAA
jgi:hypothetical protein